jgi:hypothetical protein
MYEVHSGNLQLGSWNGSVNASVVGREQDLEVYNGWVSFSTGPGMQYIYIESGGSSGLQFTGW